MLGSLSRTAQSLRHLRIHAMETGTPTALAPQTHRANRALSVTYTVNPAEVGESTLPSVQTQR